MTPPECFVHATHLADADALRCHLHELIVSDVLQRIIKAHNLGLIKGNLRIDEQK
jgi:hypothetical protein